MIISRWDQMLKEDYPESFNSRCVPKLSFPFLGSSGSSIPIYEQH
jgi:hypothetical protein